jgi:hypothetical protein
MSDKLIWVVGSVYNDGADWRIEGLFSSEYKAKKWINDYPGTIDYWIESMVLDPEFPEGGFIRNE